MTRHRAGERVKPGLYWSLPEWEIVTISSESGALPGTRDARYVRVPTLLMLMLAPIMGGLFVVFLPLIGFAILFTHLARLIKRSGSRAGADLLAALTRAMHHGRHA